MAAPGSPPGPYLFLKDAPPPLPLLFLSFDIEATGPAPGIGSMLNLGLVGFEAASGGVVFEYEANLEELPDARERLEKSEFWNTARQAEALTYIRQGARPPAEVMQELASFLRELQKKYKVEVIAWPAAYDWQWLNYYFHRFTEGNPLGYSCRDIGSFNWGLSNKKPYPDITMPEKVEHPRFSKLPGHSGMLDAFVQGQWFIDNIWKKLA